MQWTPARHALAAALEAAGYEPQFATKRNGIEALDGTSEELIVDIADMLVMQIAAGTLPETISLRDLARAARAAWPETLVALARKPQEPPRRHPGKFCTPEARKALAAQIAVRQAAKQRPPEIRDEQWEKLVDYAKAAPSETVWRAIEAYGKEIGMPLLHQIMIYEGVTGQERLARCFRHHAVAALKQSSRVVS